MVKVNIPAENAPNFWEGCAAINHFNEHWIMSDDIAVTERHVWIQTSRPFNLEEPIANIIDPLQPIRRDRILNYKIPFVVKLAPFSFG